MKNEIRAWLDSFIDSALQSDLDGHMAHISPDVQVYGVEGFEVLGYDDWQRQCAHEFPQRLIHDLRYEGLQIRSENDAQALFLINEHLTGADGATVSQALEMLLERQAGKLLLRQLRILPADEARHYAERA